MKKQTLLSRKMVKHLSNTKLQPVTIMILFVSVNKLKRPSNGHGGHRYSYNSHDLSKLYTRYSKTSPQPCKAGITITILKIKK